MSTTSAALTATSTSMQLQQRPQQPQQSQQSQQSRQFASTQAQSASPAQKQLPLEPSNNSPGTWRHPRATEIIQRKNALQFTNKNIRTAAANAACLVGLQYGSSLIYNLAPSAIPIPLIFWVLLVLRLALLFNILLAFRPIIPYVRKQDTFDDIPLTPSQRALFGLPRSRSATPITNLSGLATPPRYRHSSPSSSSRAQSPNRSASNSPFSTSKQTNTFSPTPRVSDTPFSPNSPLLHRALSQSTNRKDLAASQYDFTESTRHLVSSTNSLQGTQSMLRSSSTRDNPQVPGTPSPSARDKERARVKVEPGVNYKWLYEKGYSLQQ